MPVEIYHERQHLALCALHSLNNLFQKSIFTKSQLDEISESLTPKKWFNPHRSYIGLGNYDINVITFALERQGYDFQWFDKRKDIGAEDLQSFFGFVINCHNYFHLGSFSVPSFQNHWYCVRSVNSSYYNLDSKLSSPKLIGDQDQLVSFLKNKINDKGTSIFLIKKIT